MGRYAGRSWACFGFTLIVLFWQSLGTPVAAVDFSVLASSRTIRICDDVADPAGLDPHLVFDNKTDNILNQIYEGLVRFNSEGQIVPLLAERWEKMDPTRFRFFLHAGIRFHDGEPLTAAAVRDSIQRQLSLSSPVSMQIASIQNVVAESSYTVIIQTREPDNVLLRRLAAFARITRLVSPTKTNNEIFGEKPSGTGPYRLRRWDRNHRIVLEANPDYWNRQKPSFDEADFEFLPAEQQIETLSAGGLDLVTEVPGTRTLEIARHPEMRVIKRLTFATYAFWFTSFRGPLAKPEIRRALNIALNKESLIRYAARGNGYPIATLSMPGEIGHNQNLKPYPYNPREAKRLLHSNEWPKDFVIRLLAIEQAEREARAVQAQLHHIGIKVELTVVPISEAFRIVSSRKIRDYDLFANLAPDPIGHMCFLAWVCFHSHSPMSAGGISGFDERYDQMIRAEDPEEHRRLAEALDAWIYEQALGLFTYQRMRTYGMQATLQFQPPLTGMLNLMDIRSTDTKELKQ